MFSAVIFDLDGVVADTHPVHKKAWRQLLTELGREVSEEDLDFIVEGRRRDEILHFFLGDLSKQQIAEYGSRKDCLFRMAAGEVQPVQGVVTFLEQLERQKCPVAIATSAGKARTYFLLQKLGLAGRFLAVVTGEDVGLGKPHPETFLLAAKRIQAQAESSLVVEDSTAGVKAAKAAGMKCMGIASGDRVRRLIDAGADYVYSGFIGLTVTKLRDVLAPMAAEEITRSRAMSQCGFTL